MDREKAGVLMAVALVGGLGLMGALLRRPAGPPVISLTPVALPDVLPVTGEEGALHPPPVTAVNLTGAVKSPGVYTFSHPVRIYEAIAAAGGTLPVALTADLNLAAWLADGQKFRVPFRGEAPTRQGQPSGVSTEQFTEAESVAATRQGAAPKPLGGPVNLNTATAAQLEQLDGIGPKLAQAIVTYRRAHGRFTSAEQLLEVEGIGPKKLTVFRGQVVW